MHYTAAKLRQSEDDGDKKYLVDIIIDIIALVLVPLIFSNIDRAATKFHVTYSGIYNEQIYLL